MSHLPTNCFLRLTGVRSQMQRNAMVLAPTYFRFIIVTPKMPFFSIVSLSESLTIASSQRPLEVVLRVPKELHLPGNTRHDLRPRIHLLCENLPTTTILYESRNQQEQFPKHHQCGVWH